MPAMPPGHSTQPAPRRECCVCFDAVNEADATGCAAGHTLCRACFAQLVRSDAGVMGGRCVTMPRRPDGEIQCPGVSGGERCGHLYAAAEIARDAGSADFDLYLRGRINASIEADRGEAARAVKARDSSPGDALERLVTLACENILTLRCPRCSRAFADFDGCNALTCPACKCGFCAICFTDCGRDAHPHIREIHSVHNLWWSREKWEAHIRRRKAAACEQFINEAGQRLRLLAEVDGAAVGASGGRCRSVLCAAVALAVAVTAACGARALERVRQEEALKALAKEYQRELEEERARARLLHGRVQACLVCVLLILAGVAAFVARKRELPSAADVVQRWPHVRAVAAVMCAALAFTISSLGD